MPYCTIGGVAVQHQDVVDADAQLVGGDLREGGLLALAVRGDAGQHRDLAATARSFTVALSQPPAGVAGDGPNAQISP